MMGFTLQQWQQHLIEQGLLLPPGLTPSSTMTIRTAKARTSQATAKSILSFELFVMLNMVSFRSNFALLTYFNRLNTSMKIGLKAALRMLGSHRANLPLLPRLGAKGSAAIDLVRCFPLWHQVPQRWHAFSIQVSSLFYLSSQ
jgi:hypothetical protein